MVDKRFYKHLGSFSLAELLDGTDVDIPEGQFCDLMIENAAPVATAGASDITFVEGKRGLRDLENCKAAICLVKPDKAELVSAQGILPLVTEYPRANFAHILKKLYQPLGYGTESSQSFTDVDIAPGVVIGANVEIGAGTTIGANAVIGAGVVIGKNCHIRANATILFSILGDNCVVQSGAVLGGDGFGVAIDAKGSVDILHVGRVVLGDNVSVGCQTCIDRAMFGDTHIGNGTKLDNLIQIAHNVRIGRNCMFAAHVGISGSCVIGDGVIMGGRAGLPDHTSIGDGAILFGLASPMGDVPAGETWSGIPAMPARDYMRQVSALRKLAKKKPRRSS